MKKTRQYGLDILRIMSMVLITVIHYVAYSGIMSQPDITVYNRAILSVFSGLSVVAVNIFILITGYFSYQKLPNIKRVVALWVQVIVVGIIATLIAAIALKKQIGITTLLKTIFPFSTMHYWFFTMYIILMLASPILNLVISKLDEVQQKMVCIIGFFVLCVFLTSNPFIDDIYYIASSRGIVWLSYLYFVGAGIKKYNWNFLGKFNLLTVLCLLFAVCILKYLQKDSVGNCILLDANAVLPFALSLLLFILFRNIHIKSKFIGNVISKLSACSFLVYIIQEHNVLRDWYWNLFSINSYADSPYMIVNLIISLVALWPIALIIQWAFEKVLPIIDLIYEKVVKGINKICGAKRKDGSHSECQHGSSS